MWLEEIVNPIDFPHSAELQVLGNLIHSSAMLYMPRAGPIPPCALVSFKCTKQGQGLWQGPSSPSSMLRTQC